MATNSVLGTNSKCVWSVCVYLRQLVLYGVVQQTLDMCFTL